MDADTTLANLVIANPAQIEILESFSLDYCCNGDRTLREAVDAAGLHLDEVAAALAAVPPTPNSATEVEVGEASRAALAHDIVDTHHAYMWEEMPRLAGLVEKVFRVHGATHPELAKVYATYLEAIDELDPHMTTEERVVFPAIARMDKQGSLPSRVPLADTIEILREEHEQVGRLFQRLNELTDGYRVPADACTSYTLMLDGLREMERDLHQHIHKENNVLFPQALELQDELTASAAE